MPENENGRVPSPDKGPLNGDSLSSLAGAISSAKLQTVVRLPASKIADVFDMIFRLGYNGNLEVHFAHGRARDMAWFNSRDVEPPEV